MKQGASDGEERARRAEERARHLEQITHIGSWEWDLATNTVTWSDELYRIYGLLPRSMPITLETFLARVHPEDRPHTLAKVKAAIEAKGTFAYPERIVRDDGSIRTLETRGEVICDEQGKASSLMGTCRDVTESAKAKALSAGEQAVLEAVIDGTPLPDILANIVHVIEEQSPGTLATILLLDPDGLRVRHGAAPSLPLEFSKAIDGERIGPKAGSCGTAAHRKAPVYVTDIETDPLWDDWKLLALTHGLRACWSHPFLSKDGRVLGTFALYYRSPKAPTPEDIRLIERAAHLASVVVEHRELQAQLRALSEHVESIREDERAAIAREVHDELGQAITGLKLDLAWLGRLANKPEPIGNAQVSGRVTQLLDATDELLGLVRRISAELRPAVLDDVGLVEALEWQAAEWERRTGIACAVTATLETERLPRPVATAVFRIFQEALTNVARHAHATHVEASLREFAGELSLSVIDDGRGIRPEALSNPRSLGLLGLRERATRLGGSVQLHRIPAGGTEVALKLPVQLPRVTP